MAENNSAEDTSKSSNPQQAALDKAGEFVSISRLWQQGRWSSVKTFSAKTSQLAETPAISSSVRGSALRSPWSREFLLLQEFRS